MIYAQIKDSVIVNTIVIEENTDLTIFSVGYDLLSDVTLLSPRPGIGWTYTNGIFNEPGE